MSELPIVEFAGRPWHIDRRLRELRWVDMRRMEMRTIHFDTMFDFTTFLEALAKDEGEAKEFLLDFIRHEQVTIYGGSDDIVFVCVNRRMGEAAAGDEGEGR